MNLLLFSKTSFFGGNHPRWLFPGELQSNQNQHNEKKKNARDDFNAAFPNRMYRDGSGAIYL